MNAAPTSGIPTTDSTLRVTVMLAVIGVFVTYLPINSVSTALTTIGQSVGASTTGLQWVTVAYVIPMAAAVLSGGVIGDIYGRRRVFALGLWLTAAGALLAGLSSITESAALPLLWTGQAISGIGGGILLPTTLALISTAVPDHRVRGRYLAMWAAGTTAGLAAGPLLAGLILEFASWGWVFAPTVILAAAAAMVGRSRLVESSAPVGRRLDIPGQVAGALAIAAVIFGSVEGGSQGWDSPAAITGFAVGGAALVWFIVHELRTAHPLIELRLFQSPAFSAAALAALLALFTIVGTMFLLSLYLGSVQQLTPMEIAVRIVFVPGVAAIAGPLVGRLLSMASSQVVLIVGLVIAAIGLGLIAAVTRETTYLDVIWRLAIFGVSNAFMLASVSAVAVNFAPRALVGMAGATNTAVRQVGGALGPAVLGSIYVSNMMNGESPESSLRLAFTTSALLVAAGAAVCIVAAITSRRATARATECTRPQQPE